MSEPEYVAIEVAGRLTGVPARTLRRWAEAGKVPVVAGQRKRLVRLDDVRRLAAMTGHHPATADVAGASAGQATGHMTEGAVATTPQAYLEEIRDDWLQPLIDQLKEAERTIGRLEAENAHLRGELAATVDMPQERAPGPVRDEKPGAVAADSLLARLRRLIGR